MSEASQNIPTEKPSEKSFGVLFSLVFLSISMYPLIASKYINIWALIVSIGFLLLAYLAPKVLIFPNKLWFKFGLLLGSIIAPIVMAIIYFITVVPTGIVMRLLGKDLLNQKLDINAKSYWIERTDSIGPMKNQF
tara:strand:+ start:115 stop:519 length:405 start_codon:yes stop_codon:yes gene_type:complete